MANKFTDDKGLSSLWHKRKRKVGATRRIRRGSKYVTETWDGKKWVGKSGDKLKISNKNNQSKAKDKKDDYTPGDLTKKPTKAVYSPSLGRYVTGANIKAQAAKDREEMLKNQKNTETQKQLEAAYDQGKGGKDDNNKSSESLKISQSDKKKFPGGKGEYSKFEKSGARQSSARNSVARQKYLKKKRDKLKAGK